MREKGFTLIELLGTILILSAIVLIVAPLVIEQVTNARADISEQTKKNIVASATNWANDNKKLLPEDTKQGSVYIDLLQKEGYLEEDIKDVSDNDCVLTSNHGGAYYFEYHSINDKDDSGNLICDYYSTFKKITFNASYNGEL